MGIIARLLRIQRRVHDRKVVQPPQHVYVHVANVMYDMNDFSNEGFACTQKSGKKPVNALKINDVLPAEFILFKKVVLSETIRITWVKENQFGACVDKKGIFQKFASEFLKNNRSYS